MSNAPHKLAADLRIEPAFVGLLNTYGLTTTDTFFDDVALSSLGATRLDKPGLGPWRSRFRLPPLPAQTGETCVLFIKRFDRPPHAARREVLRSGSGARSVAGVEWAWMHRLIADGIPCAMPVALGEQFEAGREIRSVLVTREVPGQSLERWLRGWSVGDRGTIAALIHPLAELIARFHGAGYVHRDLYLAHVFFDAAGFPPDSRNGNDAGSLRLIDLQRVLRPTLRSRRFVIKDLAALNYSAASPLLSNVDRLRWLKRYLGIGKLDPVSRRLIYRVAGKTQQIARHDARRRARLGRRSGAS